MVLNKILKGKLNSSAYIKHLRKIGVKVGKNVVIYSPYKTDIDEQNPHMLTIGDNVKILSGVTILTHDFSWCVTSGIDGYISGAVSEVNIGNNVFLARHATIMRGVTIGDNVIIGAGSVVTKDCDSNSVYVGVPAQKIMSINEYLEKRKNKQLDEARNVALKYYERTGKIPNEEILREYIFLFEKRENINKKVVKRLLEDSGHYNLCEEQFLNSKPEFDGINEFLRYCGIEVI